MKKVNLLLLDALGSLDETLHWRLVIARRQTSFILLSTVLPVCIKILARDSCREIVRPNCVVLVQGLTLVVKKFLNILVGILLVNSCLG